MYPDLTDDEILEKMGALFISHGCEGHEFFAKPPGPSDGGECIRGVADLDQHSEEKSSKLLRRADRHSNDRHLSGRVRLVAHCEACQHSHETSMCGAYVDLNVPLVYDLQ